MSNKDVRGGNSGFTVGQQPYGSDQNSCPRSVLVRAYGGDRDLSDEYGTQKIFRIGFLNEDLFGEFYLKGTGAEADKKVTEVITNTSTFQGHVDWYIPSTNTPFENKSVTSAYTWKSVAGRYGEPKTTNLAQITNYMLTLEAPVGYLVYSPFVKSLQKDLKDKIYKITIDQEGKIHYNNKVSRFTVQNLIEDRKLKASVIENKTLHPVRPINPVTGELACTFCPLKDLCNEAESSEMDGDTFINKAKEIYNNAIPSKCQSSGIPEIQRAKEEIEQQRDV